MQLKRADINAWRARDATIDDSCKRKASLIELWSGADPRRRRRVPCVNRWATDHQGVRAGRAAVELQWADQWVGDADLVAVGAGAQAAGAAGADQVERAAGVHVAALDVVLGEGARALKVVRYDRVVQHRRRAGEEEEAPAKDAAKGGMVLGNGGVPDCQGADVGDAAAEAGGGV